MTAPIFHTPNSVDLSGFAARVRRQIPLLDAMEVEFIEFSGDSLVLHMPLAPNVNDKQTGFGGSIAALATACGWAMMSLVLEEAALDALVVVVKSEIRYLAPVTGDCHARCTLPEAEKKRLLGHLSNKGRASTEIVLEVLLGEQLVAHCNATYHARLVQGRDK